ncbi:MAG: 1,4-dihydroxy-6-naphthoate synthase [Planctomycetes bacterium]|nr:1,4-dihydroxy-6-naphthoate synthase [Planctomycetota bacterium]
MKLRIGLSPCPNDTFLFHALLAGLVPTPGVTWEPVMEDVEALNARMLAGELPVTKASFAAFAQTRDTYACSRTGAALGRGNGPLIVSKRPLAAAELGPLKVLIPGEHTTAALLLRVFHPEITDTPTARYDRLLDLVLREEADAAVIIHELRFTYAQRGLHAIEDLGSRWETMTKLPCPLGGIFIRRDVEPALAKRIETWIGASLAYARAHPEASREFIRANAQEIETGTTQRHIDLYVNEFSAALGKQGEEAIRRLMLIAEKTGAAPKSRKETFVGGK